MGNNNVPNKIKYLRAEEIQADAVLVDDGDDDGQRIKSLLHTFLTIILYATSKGDRNFIKTLLNISTT